MLRIFPSHSAQPRGTANEPCAAINLITLKYSSMATSKVVSQTKSQAGMQNPAPTWQSLVAVTKNNEPRSVRTIKACGKCTLLFACRQRVRLAWYSHATTQRRNVGAKCFDGAGLSPSQSQAGRDRLSRPQRLVRRWFGGHAQNLSSPDGVRRNPGYMAPFPRIAPEASSRLRWLYFSLVSKSLY